MVTLTSPALIESALARLGYSEFRPGQREAIEVILEQGRLLLVAPTGGGKSLSYQLPATILGGTTVVVSPLVSLMQDQVAALTSRGVPATFLAATLPSRDLRDRMSRLGQGEYTIAYVAPERLAFAGFRGLARDLECPLIAIDEAHCISEWGHDFRPEYLEIGGLLTDLPRARVLACTATATPIVRDEILARLGLPASTPQLVRGFARPNLGLHVEETGSRSELSRIVDEWLRRALGGPEDARGTAIVYAPTRRQTEEEAARLAQAGWKVSAYHAGLDGTTRHRAQAAFRDGELQVIVATNAFGMGIDRADVRIVVHLAPPGSVEAYYQEVGRAGRDGLDAVGVLCTSRTDLPLRRRLLEAPIDGETPDPARVQHRWSMFLELMRWAEGGSCRHDAILRYFGDEVETLSGCGRCDNCTGLDEGSDATPDDTAVIVRKALSAVARLQRRFGLSAAVKLLAGVPDPRLRRAGLEASKTFGALRGRSEDWLQALLRRCASAGWIDFSTGDRPVVFVTALGKTVLFDAGPVRLLLPPSRSGSRKGRSGVGREPRKREIVPTLTAAAVELFEALRAKRLELARDGGIPPYVVASDRTLRELVELKPRSRDELVTIYGIGPAKAAKYGEELLAVVRRAG